MKLLQKFDTHVFWDISGIDRKNWICDTVDRLSSRHAITTETILSIFQLFMLSRGCGCFWSTLWLLLSDRQHLSYDGCLEVRGHYQNCVYWICTQSLSLAHLDEQFLQFSALGFVTLGPYRLLSVFLFISVYLCVFCVFLFLFYNAYHRCPCKTSLCDQICKNHFFRNR